MFTVVSFVIAKTYKWPACLLMGEWMNCGSFLPWNTTHLAKE